MDSVWDVMDWLEEINRHSVSADKIRQVIEDIGRTNDLDLIYQLGLRVSNLDVVSGIVRYLGDDLIFNLIQERNNPEVISILLEGITEDGVLWHIFNSAPSGETRLKCLNLMIERGSEKLYCNLQDAVRREQTPGIAAKLISQLDPVDDVELLSHLVFSSEHVGPRIEAVRLITNQKVLYEVLQKEVNGDVRAEATRNLSVPYLLRDLARNDLYWRVRMEAIRVLKSPEIMEEALENDPSTEIRKFCLRNIDDISVVSYIAMNEYNDELRKAAVTRVAEMGDRETLWVVAQKEENLEIKLLAISHIDNQTILSNILDRVEYSEEFSLITGKITDPYILRERMINSSNLKYNRILVKRLIELGAVGILSDLRDEMIGSVRSMIDEYLES